VSAGEATASGDLAMLGDYRCCPMREGVLGAEHMTVRARGPLPPCGRHVQAGNGVLPTRRDPGSADVGIALDRVRQRDEANLLELMEEAVCRLQVERVLELPDQARGLDPPSLSIIRFVCGRPCSHASTFTASPCQILAHRLDP
jgi:hypothetical protein